MTTTTRKPCFGPAVCCVSHISSSSACLRSMFSESSMASGKLLPGCSFTSFPALRARVKK